MGRQEAQVLWRLEDVVAGMHRTDGQIKRGIMKHKQREKAG